MIFTLQQPNGHVEHIKRIYAGINSRRPQWRLIPEDIKMPSLASQTEQGQRQEILWDFKLVFSSFYN